MFSTVKFLQRTNFIGAILLLLVGRSTFGQAVNIKSFKVEEAKQAVAVDKDHFYVINNSAIRKYTKSDGKLVASWDGTALGIQHLNSGVVIKGKLYCANSNFPDMPMASAVEIFDVKTMQHVGNHSFGISPYGSLTWIDQKDGYWYIGFAHYSGKNASEGRDVRWTSLVKYNADWVQVEAWTYPKNLLELFAPMSNSGGAWGNDGLLYLTGHDHPELYAVKLPKSGYILEYVKTIPVSMPGQGIAFDRDVKGKVIVYGIHRAHKEVVIDEIK